MSDTRTALTKEQKEKYIANGAGVCESSDISGGQVEIDGMVAWQEVDCAACGAEWQDIYRLTDVKVNEPYCGPQA